MKGAAGLEPARPPATGSPKSCRPCPNQGEACLCGRLGLSISCRQPQEEDDRDRQRRLFSGWWKGKFGVLGESLAW